VNFGFYELNVEHQLMRLNMKIELPNKPTIKRMDVATIYNVHPNTIARWEQANKFPKGHKPAGDKGHVHYWTEDIKAHLERMHYA